MKVAMLPNSASARDQPVPKPRSTNAPNVEWLTAPMAHRDRRSLTARAWSKSGKFLLFPWFRFLPWFSWTFARSAPFWPALTTPPPPCPLQIARRAAEATAEAERGQARQEAAEELVSMRLETTTVPGQP